MTPAKKTPREMCFVDTWEHEQRIVAPPTPLIQTSSARCLQIGNERTHPVRHSSVHLLVCPFVCPFTQCGAFHQEAVALRQQSSF